MLPAQFWTKSFCTIFFFLDNLAWCCFSKLKWICFFIAVYLLYVLSDFTDTHWCANNILHNFSFSDSIEKQMNQPPPDIEYVSTTRSHFTKGYYFIYSVNGPNQVNIWFLWKMWYQHQESKSNPKFKRKYRSYDITLYRMIYYRWTFIAILTFAFSQTNVR